MCVQILRVLHVAYSCVPGSYRGGVPKVVFELARAQARLGVHVSVHTTNLNSGVVIDVPLEVPVRKEGIEITYHRARLFPEYRSKGLKDAVSQAANRCDVLHTHNTFLSFNRDVRSAGRRAGKPYFVHPHGALDPAVVRRGFVKSWKKRIYIFLFERRNLNQAAVVFALSDREKDQLLDMGIRSPIHVVGNGVRIADAQDHLRFRQKRGIEESAPIVLYIGRFHEKKGLDILIQAFAKAGRGIPAARLVLVGDRFQNPRYVERLDQLIQESGIHDRVIWTGFLDEDAKAEALSAATLFSHVSQSEGMAMAILESMAAGLPTIISDGCYMDRAVREGAVALSGYDVDQLSQKIQELLVDEGLRNELSRKAKAYVVEHHSWEAIAEETIRIYEMSLNRNGKRAA